MAEFKPEHLRSLFAFQPLRLAYIIYARLASYLIWTPYWFISSIKAKNRPRKSWSLSKTLMFYQFKYEMTVNKKTSSSNTQTPNHLALDEDPRANGIWIDPIPDGLMVSRIKEWADTNQVKPTRIPGYWMFGKRTTPTSSFQIMLPPTTRSNDKVILFFHGGAFISRSAHPNDSIANITNALVDAGAPNVKAALSVEYRLSRGPPFETANPFPAALIDALSGYLHLLKMGFSPGNIIFTGDSAGGNLALALTRYTIELNTEGITTITASGESRHALQFRPPGGLLLLSPWVDLGAGLVPTPDDSSIIINASSDFVNSPHSQSGLYATHAYAGTLGPSALRENAYISPSTSQFKLFKGFPRTFIVSGDAEVGLDAIRALRDRMVSELGWGDDGVVYFESVDAWHDFVGFDWCEPQRSQALKEISVWFNSLLH